MRSLPPGKGSNVIGPKLFSHYHHIMGEVNSAMSMTPQTPVVRNIKHTIPVNALPVLEIITGQLSPQYSFQTRISSIFFKWFW